MSTTTIKSVAVQTIAMGLTDRLKRGLDEVKLVLRGFGARVLIRLRLREEDDFDIEIGPDTKR